VGDGKAIDAGNMHSFGDDLGDFVDGFVFGVNVDFNVDGHFPICSHRTCAIRLFALGTFEKQRF
jgi:hypothetical protein